APGREFLDSGEQRLGTDRCAEHEVVRQRCSIQLADDVPAGENRLRLAGKDEAVVRQHVVERLDPERISSEEERVRALVPDRNGEHALEAVEEVGPPLAIPVDDDFGVRVVGAELVALGRELLPKRAEVVDLAVEDDVHQAVGRRHRLLPVDQVQNREPVLPEDDPVALPFAPAVGTAVILPQPHPADASLEIRAVTVVGDDAEDAAHLPDPSLATADRNTYARKEFLAGGSNGT